ncbi:MAG: tetratricopeptide repeat protein [Janthinobacterium lividum]
MPNGRDANIDGNVSQSVVVTGDGNTVRLSFGDSRVVLRLRRKHVRQPDRRPAWPAGPQRELDLLDPERGTLPFVGRADTMGVLRGWAESEAKVSVLAVTGRAGSGKTRLALELCEALDPQSGGGAWDAGFVSGPDLAEVVKALATRTFDWSGQPRVLVVIDNAAQCHRAVAGWLDRLSGEELGAARLRVLLLEREAPEGFGWWHELSGDLERRDLFDAPSPMALPDLDDVEARRALVGAALSAAALMRSVTTLGRIPAAGEQPEVDRVLAGAQFGSPLNLVMAGVLALDQGLGAALSLRRLDAARWLGERELKRFRDLAAGAGVSDDAMRHAIAFNALAGGLSCSTLLDTLSSELTAAHVEAGRLHDLAKLLTQELPPPGLDQTGGGGQHLGVIQPDLVAEAVTIAVFTGEPWRDAEGAKALTRAYALDPDRTAVALMRLLQDFGYAMEDPAASPQEQAVSGRLMGWLQMLVAGVDDSLALAPIAFAFPEHSLVLREVAADVQMRVAKAFQSQAEQSGKMDAAAAAATALNNLANRLDDLGRWDEALEAAQEAVKLRRALVAVRPDVFAPSLVSSLNVLATSLGSLGCWDAALAAAQEAVSLSRVLASTHPETFTRSLAMSLSNLANRLGDFDRREEALEAAREAVGLCRDLVAASLDAFTPKLAMSVSNLAARLNDLGHRAEALEAAQEAVGLLRTLAAARPDAFRPNLAVALNNLSNMLNHPDRLEAALEAAQESVDLHRTLAETRPDVFTPLLAVSLQTLAARLNGVGNPVAALNAAQQAVDLDRALATTRPYVFKPNLAASLNNFANLLSALNRPDAALEAAHEAVVLRRIVATARPDVFASDLAMSLGNLANKLDDLGRPEAALEAALEAVHHYRGPAAARPGVFAPNLATVLRDLANRLGNLGRPEAALEAAQESVNLCRAVAVMRPDLSTPELAMSLNTLANRLSDLGRREAALEASRESVSCHRVLDNTRPGAFTRSFAKSLSNLAIRLGDLMPLAPALETGRQAVELYRVLAASDPDVLPDLARSLWFLGELLSRDGQARQGVNSLEEAIALLMPSALAHAGAARRRINDVVQSYLVRCREAGIEPDFSLLEPLLPPTDKTGESA